MEMAVGGVPTEPRCPAGCSSQRRLADFLLPAVLPVIPVLAWKKQGASSGAGMLGPDLLPQSWPVISPDSPYFWRRLSAAGIFFCTRFSATGEKPVAIRRGSIAAKRDWIVVCRDRIVVKRDGIAG